MLEKCLLVAESYGIYSYHSIREKLFHGTSGSHFKQYGFVPSHKMMQMHLETVKHHNLISFFSVSGGSEYVQISRGSRDIETQKMSSEFRLIS